MGGDAIVICSIDAAGVTAAAAAVVLAALLESSYWHPPAARLRSEREICKDWIRTRGAIGADFPRDFQAVV